MRFSELKEKEVINCKDCKRIGFVTDIVINECNGTIKELIVPEANKLFGYFCPTAEYIIPYCDIVRIGPDIILVDVPLEKISGKNRGN